MIAKKMTSSSTACLEAPGLTLQFGVPRGTTDNYPCEDLGTSTTVSSISPSGGAGGTSVTINGSGFTNATAVNFGGTPATNVNVESDTQITCDAPAGTGTVDVTVVGQAVTSPASSADQFTYTVTAPALDHGPHCGGGQGRRRHGDHRNEPQQLRRHPGGRGLHIQHQHPERGRSRAHRLRCHQPLHFGEQLVAAAGDYVESIRTTSPTGTVVAFS